MVGWVGEVAGKLGGRDGRRRGGLFDREGEPRDGVGEDADGGGLAF